jgi:hypothetical protein
MTPAMLAVTRRSAFSRDYDVRDGIAPVAEFRLSAFGERTDLRVGLDLYQARRTGWINSGFVLERYDREVARADSEGFFRRGYAIRAPGIWATLRQRGFMRSDFGLFVGDTEVGSIRRTGFWRTTIEASFRPELDRPIQVFLIWIAAILWRRAASAAAST